jgi:hypothetical protein
MRMILWDLGSQIMDEFAQLCGPLPQCELVRMAEFSQEDLEGAVLVVVDMEADTAPPIDLANCGVPTLGLSKTIEPDHLR